MIDIRKYLNKKWIYNENEIEKIEKFFNRNDIIKKLKKEETNHTFSKMEKPI